MSKNYAINLSAAFRAISALTFAAVLVIASGAFVDRAAGQRRQSLNAPNRHVRQVGNDRASVLFRSARDMISDQQWASAEEKFNQYISSYPDEKNVDAALYWMAYAQYQLTRFELCKSTINRLLNTYQNSSWREDARTLLAQVPGSVGALLPPLAPKTSVGTGHSPGASTRATTTNGDLPAVAGSAPGGSTQTTGRGGGHGSGIGSDPAPKHRHGVPSSTGDNDDLVSDDDPCEFKIVILQALFQSDAQRGISVATEWLALGSTVTARCKGAALTLLGRHGGPAAIPVILLAAQREAELKVRARAISALAATADDSVINPLRDFALTSKESDIVAAAVYALGRHTGARALTVLAEIALSDRSPALRRIAIASIANRPDERSVDELLKIYDGDLSVDVRKSVIAGFAHGHSERAGQKLLELAGGSDNVELRKAALSAIATRNEENAVDILLSLYDTEKSDEVKDRIINLIGPFSDPRVTRKLIEIARDPQSPIDRRRRAIGWLRRGKDSEITKSLEDLLK